MKSIKLAVVNTAGKKVYRVITVKNSVVYAPGEELLKDEVEGLCINASWDVTVVGNKEAGQ